jgi:hypothetical protein
VRFCNQCIHFRVQLFSLFVNFKFIPTSKNLVALKDVNLSTEDRDNINEAMDNHGEKARQQRNVMKSAILEWGGNQEVYIYIHI